MARLLHLSAVEKCRLKKQIVESSEIRLEIDKSDGSSTGIDHDFRPDEKMNCLSKFVGTVFSAKPYADVIFMFRNKEWRHKWL